MLLFACEGPTGPEGKAGDPGAAGTAGAAGAKGDPGPAGAKGTDVDPAVLAAIQAKLDAAGNVDVETCSICHAGHGMKKHQAIYNKYIDSSDLALFWVGAVATDNNDGTFNTTVTFKITRKGLPYEDIDKLPSLDQKTFYSVKYDAATRTFDGSNSFSSSTIKPVPAQPGWYTVSDADVPYDITAPGFNGHFYGYIADDKLDTESGGHVTMYDNVASVAKAFGTEATTPYQSLANVSGCERCHGKPYMKHGYRDPIVAGLGDFASCKVCHYDTRNGGHPDWQLLVDNPTRYAELDKLAKAAAAIGDTSKNSIAKNMTTAELAKYAYTATLMNDVHMAHAMEFPYPQKMSNCATCHDGKLTQLFDDAKFVKATCVSCHAWKGEAKYGTDKMAMESIWARAGASILSMHQGTTAECNTCHKDGGAASGKRLKDLHNGGFDPKIYTKDGAKRYSEVFVAKIDAASYDANTNKLTVEFSASEVGGASAIASHDATDIEPTILVGMYGYNTKDFIVNAHGSDANGKRLLEFPLDTTNPRLKVVTSTAPNWKIEIDLTMWATQLKDKVIRRAEISFLPTLRQVVNDKDVDTGTCNPACSRGQHCDASNKCVPNDDVILALDAPSRTFDFGANSFDDAFYADIVDVKKCNNCHDALATSFHTGNRGGNVRVCRTCHVVLNGASHLELQSRSIDSYVHSIHSFQAFDPGDIDFKDPVEKLRYQHHIEHVFPNFSVKNCEACHNPGTYVEPPDSSQSLAGILSGSDKVADRNIGTIKSYVTGPGARACGACHRSHMINEDKAGKLEAFYRHLKSNGYLVEDGTGVLDKVIETIMGKFQSAP